MRLADLQSKDIVNINSGKNLGRIIDVEIDELGTVIYFTVEERVVFRRLLRSREETNIKMSAIKKIGEDVILVEI